MQDVAKTLKDRGITFSSPIINESQLFWGVVMCFYCYLVYKMVLNMYGLKYSL
jgi:hypothetical protein